MRICKKSKTKKSKMIKGLFYSEFDNVAGPQIVFQAPHKCVLHLPVNPMLRTIPLTPRLVLSVRLQRAEQRGVRQRLGLHHHRQGALWEDHHWCVRGSAYISTVAVYVRLFTLLLSVCVSSVRAAEEDRGVPRVHRRRQVPPQRAALQHRCVLNELCYDKQSLC